MRCRVFISGGGVAGLTLGLTLVKQGIDVVLAERRRGEGLQYKGELLQPKSLQVLDRLGVLAPVAAGSFPVRTMRLRELGGESGSSAGAGDAVFDYSILAPPYHYALMHPHEQLKGILLDGARRYPAFTLLQPGNVTGLKRGADGRVRAAAVETPDGTVTVEADFFLGAEGRVSPIRSEMDIGAERAEYNHHFLTVSFDRPPELREATVISRQHRFLGLFPLPGDRVRTVLLIRPDEYKAMRTEGLSRFSREYIRLYPAMDGYVQRLESWKQIQLMIPFRYNAERYVRDNLAIVGDAAHNVHPMAGEGMNMAIQDADILGRLIAHLYHANRPLRNALYWYDRVRRPRSAFVLKLSHLSALAYSYDYPGVSRLRGRVLQSIAASDYLLFKYMLNVSGLGQWPDTPVDRLMMLGLWPDGRPLSEPERLGCRFTDMDDYPWLGGESLPAL